MKIIFKITVLIFFINFGLCINLQARNDMKFDHAIKIGSACTSAVIQNRDGLIWIGSLTGLIKYDGYKLKYYTSSNSTISGEYLTSILEDDEGILWCSSDQGLIKFNPENETAKLYTKGSNNDGVWNEEGLSLKVIVTTPFWKSWWFYCMLALPIIIYVIKLQTEINKKRRVEEALRKSEVRFRTIYENAPVLINAFDENGRFVFWNKQCRKTFGWTIDEINAHYDTLALFYPDPAVHDKVMRIISTEPDGRRFTEWHPVTKDGKSLTIMWANFRLPDGMTFNLGYDITARKQTEEALRKSEERLGTILSTMNIGLILHNPDRTVAWVNQWVRQMFQHGDPVGRVCYEFFEGKSSPCDPCAVRDCFETGGEINTVESHNQANNHWYSSIAHPIKDNTNQVTQVLESVMDITEHKRAEEELTKYREHLEKLVEKRTEALQKVNIEYAAANKELKEFAYIVSHDLKAPLRAISQLTHWISEDYSHLFDDDGKKQMDLILQRVKRMYGLIDGILHYSRIGQIREKEEHLDMNLLVNEVIDNIAPPDTVRIIFENKLPVVLKDSTRMEQIFQNLIGNAIKFMDKDEGIIKVGCADEGAFWKFSVSDNGPGIDKRYHDKIFQIFQTLTPRDERESTGIGLTLVKKIIEFYGGSVWVESEAGKGSTFVFTLPKTGRRNQAAKKNIR